MASVDKVRIGNNTYDISPSASGTLKSEDFTSRDSSSATSWDTSSYSTNPITTSDNQSTIFSKVTTMVKNIRYLYNKLGTTPYDHPTNDDTVSTALRNLQDGKANSTHDHQTNTLPISSTQVNSGSYVPTSSLVYSMNQTLEGIGNKFTMGSDFTTNIDCGALKSGTEISGEERIGSVLKRMMYSTEPSTEYESKSLGTWSSTTGVDNFFSAHNVSNGFSGIKIGNYVTINDGTYNAQWVVAGFTCEHNATASDGTVYDNGVGMLMIPKTELTTYRWHSGNTSYMNSAIHSFINSTVYNTLKSKLGNHIIQRNVLLGSAQNGAAYEGTRGGGTSAYTWTKSYLTLMSIGQMNGAFRANNNLYDDGEANYKLPLFDHEEFKTGSDFWSRCIWGFSSKSSFCPWRVLSDGSFDHTLADFTYGVRPLMLLR